MLRVFGQSGFSRRLPIVLLAGAGMFFFCMARQTAMADDLTGYMDLTYFHNQGNSSSSLGPTTATTSDGFRQQYGLTLNRALYPNLHLLASGIFERTRVNVTQNENDTTVISTISQPYLDLTLRDPFFTVGGTYSEQETRAETVGFTTATQFNRTYSSILSLRPAGLPTIDLHWRDLNIFDRSRTVMNVNDGLLSLIAYYEPVKSVRLRYASNREDVEDKIRGTDVLTTSDSARVNYDAGWFNNRVIVSANYQNDRQETSSTGVLRIQQFAFSGLAAIDDTPVLGPLDANLPLADGVTEVGAGITIGLPVTVPGARNIGLDFESTKKVDTLSLWVIWNNSTLPIEIANSFSWTVYTSSDPTTGQCLNWTLQTTVFPASFASAYNRFDIAVPGLTARCIKVVVNPLTPAAAAASPTFSTAADQQIYVTELQAFATVSTTGGSVVSTTQIVDGSAKVRLTDAPLLFYEFAYYSSTSEGFESARRQSITNGLSVSHRFNQVFSGTSRLLREDDSSPEGDTVSYRLNVSLNAIPLPTLNHTLSYNYADVQAPTEDIKRNSVYLTNTIGLYRGVDANLSGGLSAQTSSTGVKQDSSTVMFGATVAPRTNLSINPSYSATSTDQTGGGLPDKTNATRTKDLSVVYAPLPAIFLTASWGSVTQSGRQDRLKNYGASWSPFPGGALQISVSYTENLRSTDNNITTFLTETARWNITSKTFLQLSHYDSQTSSTTVTSDTTGYTAELRYAF